MSYLDPLRLHFFGKFQAAPSTVNNDPLHFDNAKFKPSYQQLWNATAANGWWNPLGDAIREHHNLPSQKPTTACTFEQTDTFSVFPLTIVKTRHYMLQNGDDLTRM